MFSYLTNSVKGAKEKVTNFINEDMESKRRMDERARNLRLAQELALTQFEVLSNQTMTERILQIVAKASPSLFPEVSPKEE
jgi:hypothetical protein